MSYKVTINGKQVEVSYDTYKKILEEADDTNYYNSSSKGRIRIVDMADEHLRNAIIKLSKESVVKRLDSLRQESLSSVYQTLSGGISFVTPVIEALMQESQRRNLKW